MGHLVGYGTAFDPAATRELMKAAPEPVALRSQAEAQWGHVRIAAEYVEAYRAAISGARWRKRASTPLTPGGAHSRLRSLSARSASVNGRSSQARWLASP